MTDISFKNLSNKTTIEVSPTFLDKIAKEALPKINDSFVPPLFSEYCISIIEKNGNFNYFKANLILEDKIISLNKDIVYLNNLNKQLKKTIEGLDKRFIELLDRLEDQVKRLEDIYNEEW